MNTRIKEPLVLIVDDDPEYREEILPEFVKTRLAGRALVAADVKSGLKVAAEHDPQSVDPLDLAIVDMHMPESPDTVAVKEGGIECVTQALGLRVHPKPVVVFTAYPDYANCVKAIRAGARAYVEKLPDTGEPGIDILERECKRLLAEEDEIKEKAPPSAVWMDRNYAWLCERYPGKWVAVVDESTGDAAQVNRAEKVLRDGLYVLVGSTFRDVRADIIDDAALRAITPAIVMLPCRRNGVAEC